MVADSLARVRKDFDSFLEEKVNLDWEDQRQRIYEHFGLAPKDDRKAGGSFGRATVGAKGPDGFASRGKRSVFGRSALGKSVIGSPSFGPGSSRLLSKPANGGNGDMSMDAGDSRFTREKIGHFAGKVQSLNEARLQKFAFPLLHQFGEVESLGEVCKIGYLIDFG